MHGKPKPASMYARFHSTIMSTQRHLAGENPFDSIREAPNWMECQSMGEGLWMHIDKYLKQEVSRHARRGYER